MAERLINDVVSPLAVNNVRVGSGVAANTAEVITFILTDGTTDPGTAAGTIVYGKTSLSPILNALGDRAGLYSASPLHTSTSFADGVIIAANEVGFIYDANGDARLTKTAERLLVNGAYAIDYETGLFVIRKATVDTTLTLSYNSPSTVTGAGGPASDVNVSQFGGSNVSLGQAAMAGSMPVVISSDQSSIPVTTGPNTVILDLTDTIVATGVPQQATAASTPCLSAVVQNLSTTNTLRTGNAASQSIVLFSFDSRSIPIDDFNKIYVVGTAGDTFAVAGTN